MNLAGVQNQSALINDRWKSSENPGNGFIPRAIRSDYALGQSASSRYIFDASYVRIKDITLSYDFPLEMLSKIRMKGLNAYFNISNVYTFTKVNLETLLHPQVWMEVSIQHQEYIH